MSYDNLADCVPGADIYPQSPYPSVGKLPLRRLISNHTREGEVLDLAARGLTDPQIGLELGLSLGDLAEHWRRIFLKCGVPNRIDAIAKFLEYLSTDAPWDLPRPEANVERQTSGPLASRHQEAERLVTQAENLHRRLIDHFPGAVYFENVEGTVEFLNESFKAMFAVTAAHSEMILGDCWAAKTCLFSLFADPHGFTNRVDELIRDGEDCLRESVVMADGRLLERDFVVVRNNGSDRRPPVVLPPRCLADRRENAK